MSVFVSSKNIRENCTEGLGLPASATLLFIGARGGGPCRSPLAGRGDQENPATRPQAPVPLPANRYASGSRPVPPPRGSPSPYLSGRRPCGAAQRPRRVRLSLEPCVHLLLTYTPILPLILAPP